MNSGKKGTKKVTSSIESGKKGHAGTLSKDREGDCFALVSKGYPVQKKEWRETELNQKTIVQKKKR